MSKKNSASLIVKLEGDSTIEVSTLISILASYVDIAKRANEIVGQGDYKAEVKVKALQKGSFEISLEMITSWLGRLLSRENVSYVSDLVSIIIAVPTIFFFFKGRKASKEEIEEGGILKELTAEMRDNAIKLYLDEQIRRSFRKAIREASKDYSVQGITHLTDGKQSPTLEADEFAEILNQDDEERPEVITITDEGAVLTIISLSFNKGDKWSFIYNGYKISSYLSDDGLQEAIDRRVAFAKGDALVAHLEITQQWDKNYKVYVNRSYKVAKVLKHVQQPDPQVLFYGEEGES